MKFLRYPLAIVAYSLLGIFILAWAWNFLGHSELDTYWYYFPAGAGIYLLISFVLSKMKLQWEWDVAFQVAFVLAPVLWYVNIKEPYRRPVYIFVVNSGYTGKLDVIYNLDKNAPTNAHSSADTLYFNFDEQGQILLNEDASYVKESMRKQLFFLNHNGSKDRIPFADKNSLPTDTTKIVVVEDSMIVEAGRMKEMRYRLNYPEHLK